LPHQLLKHEKGKGKGGGRLSALKSVEASTIRGIHYSREATAKDTQQTTPLAHATHKGEVQEVVEKLNETPTVNNTTSLRFSYHHERQVTIMQVIKAVERPG
jgi:uncharacterized FlaG/YvyC family protein